jgi:hypothetical protein
LALKEAARISTWPCSHLQVVSQFCSLAGDGGPQIASENFDGRQRSFSTLKPSLGADDAPQLIPNGRGRTAKINGRECNRMALDYGMLVEF